MVDNPGFWGTYFVVPVLNGLLFFYAAFKLLGIPGAMGWGIIAFVSVLRLILHPFFKNTAETQKKMQEMQPQLEKLKKKYEKDPQKLQQEQMLLYQQAGVNPASGCLVMIVQIAVFISLYNALNFLSSPHMPNMAQTVSQSTQISQEKVHAVWDFYIKNLNKSPDQLIILTRQQGSIADLSGADLDRAMSSLGQQLGMLNAEVLKFRVQRNKALKQEDVKKIGNALTQLFHRPGGSFFGLGEPEPMPKREKAIEQVLAEQVGMDKKQVVTVLQVFTAETKFNTGEYEAFFADEVKKITYVPAIIDGPLKYEFLSYDLSLTPHQGGTIWYMFIPVITALLQLAQAQAMPIAKKAPSQGDESQNKKASDNQGFQQALNLQMKYFFPVMLGFVAYNLPLGLSLYWNTNSIFSIMQYKGGDLWKLFKSLKKKLKN